MDVIVIFHLDYFLSFYPPNSSKNENFKEMYKTLGMSSFYTSVPKIMIMWYTVPKILCVTDEIVFLFWAIFCPFTPLTCPKNENFKKPEKNI